MAQTVLLVDDSTTMREVLKVYLMGRDFEFLEASNGERALTVLKMVPVSLIFVDLKMPNMGGLEFLEQLRTIEPALHRRHPVILVTADKKAEAESLAKDAGADAFLKKPLNSDRVIKAVDELLNRKAK